MPNWNQQIIDEFHDKGGRGVTNFGDRLLLLTSRGARSGQERTTPVMFHRENGNLVIVASKGGAPVHPGWYHNLRAHPDATIEIAGDSGIETLKVRAREAQGEERDRIFADRVAIAPTFAEYERKTTRKIPVVILEPAAG
jgi:deazaflavin-dependent oxidoreductase (nitroreductase family)